MATPGPRTRSNSFDQSRTTDSFKDMVVASTPLQYPSLFTTINQSVSHNEINTRTGFFSDVVVDNFHQRRAQGAIFNNPMDSGNLDVKELASGILMSQVQTGCAYDHSDWSKHYVEASNWQVTGEVGYSDLCAGSATASSFLDLIGVPELSVSTIQNIAVSQAWANIDQSEILALASAKEANTTASGLINTAQKVVKVFRAVKKFDAKKAKGLLFKDPRTRAKKLKSIASQAEDVYMEARYNLRPLYYDMLGVLKLTVPSRPRQTFRGYESRVSDLTDQEVYKYTGCAAPTLGTGVNLRVNRTARRSVTARAGVLTDILDPGLANRSGITALPQTLYDLTPYSFIADWFFNVGDTMLSWVPKPGVRTLASWVTVEQIDECSNQICLENFDAGTGPVTPWSYGAYGHTINFQMIPSTKSWRNVRKWRLPNPSRAIIPSFVVNMDPLKKLDLFIILKKMVSYRRI